MKIITDVDYLHKKCEAISYKQSLEIKRTMHKFLLTNKNIFNNTLGLACNQLGLGGRVIMFRGSTKHTPKYLINPTIIEKSEDMLTTTEYCLSVPGQGISIERHKKIVLMHTTGLYNVWEYHKPNPSESIVIQHELEHLDGILISDYIEEEV